MMTILGPNWHTYRNVSNVSDMVKFQKMQFHGFYFPLEMVRRDKAGIKFSSHINCNEKNMRVCWCCLVCIWEGHDSDPCCCRERCQEHPMPRWWIVPLTVTSAASFSNNGPVLQRDCDVDYIMANDVLYSGKQQGTHCFHPSSVTSMQRSRSRELTPIGSFWNKALGRQTAVDPVGQ